MKSSHWVDTWLGSLFVAALLAACSSQVADGTGDAQFAKSDAESDSIDRDPDTPDAALDDANNEPGPHDAGTHEDGGKVDGAGGTFVGVSSTPLISSGTRHTCAVTPSGGVKCWGFGARGQLGNGSGADSNVAVSVSSISSVTALASAGAFTCALLSDGTVKCWGEGGSGELGRGDLEDALVPVQVTGLSGATAIAVGNGHGCALVAGGTAKCWGGHGDPFKVIGHPSVVSTLVPVDVPGVAGATAIAAGGRHTCVVVAGGAVKCWGYSDAGALGTGVYYSTTPTDVPGISGVVSLAASDDETCALMSNATVKCWGDNLYGQLGNGSYVKSSSPVEVQGLSGALAISVGGDHTCAIENGGKVKCWGSNAEGELGVGTYDVLDSNVPLSVVGLNGVVSLSASTAPYQNRTCARLATGAAKCWGYGDAGELGNGASASTNAPSVVVGFP